MNIMTICVLIVQSGLLRQRRSTRLHHHFPYTAHRHPLLLHIVPVPHGNGTVLLRLVINGHTEGRTNSIHPAIPFANGVLFFIEALKMRHAFLHEFAGNFRQSIFLHQRQNGQFDGARKAATSTPLDHPSFPPC